MNVVLFGLALFTFGSKSSGANTATRKASCPSPLQKQLWVGGWVGVGTVDHEQDMFDSGSATTKLVHGV